MTSPRPAAHRASSFSGAWAQPLVTPVIWGRGGRELRFEGTNIARQRGVLAVRGDGLRPTGRPRADMQAKGCGESFLRSRWGRGAGPHRPERVRVKGRVIPLEVREGDLHRAQHAGSPSPAEGVGLSQGRSSRNQKPSPAAVPAGVSLHPRSRAAGTAESAKQTVRVPPHPRPAQPTKEREGPEPP